MAVSRSDFLSLAKAEQQPRFWSVSARIVRVEARVGVYALPPAFIPPPLDILH